MAAKTGKKRGKEDRSKRRDLQPCEAQTEGGAYSCPERGSIVSRETDRWQAKGGGLPGMIALYGKLEKGGVGWRAKVARP